MPEGPGGRREERRAARERALELLYESELKDQDPIEVLAALPVSPDPYAVELTGGVADHRHQLDRLLVRVSSWPLDRMAALDRAVLRLGVFELALVADVPDAVAVNEAVELAKRFSTEESGRFVNGVLGAAVDLLAADPWLPIDGLLLDVDGVIRHWHDQELRDAEVELGLEPGALFSIAFEPKRLDRAMVGALTDAEWRTEVGEEAAARHGVDAAFVTQLWHGVRWSIDADVVGLVEAVRAAGSLQRVGLFSNATTRLETDLAECGVDGAVDVVVNSARINLAKPAVEAFHVAAGLLQVEPPMCLFVDDRSENVEGALEAGLQAIQFRGADRLRRVLQRYQVLDAAAA